MKKIIFLSTIISMTLIININANKIQEAVQQLNNEITPVLMPISKEQSELMKQLKPQTGYGYFYTDEQQNALRKNPQTMEFLKNSCSLDAQALGTIFCLRCINKMQNPTAQDLKTCHEKWLESHDRKQALDSAGRIEGYLLNSESRWSTPDFFNADDNHHKLRDAFHEGDRKFAKRIRKIIKEKSEK